MDKKKTGKVTKEPEGYKVQFERHFNCNVLTLWKAITDPEKLAVWFMKVEMELKVGAGMTIYYGDEHNTKGYGQITAIETGKLFEYTWENEEDAAGYEVTRWELFQEGPSASRLLFTHTRISEEYRWKVPSGWHIMLDHLAQLVNGNNGPFTTTSTEDEKVKTFYNELITKTFNHG